MKRLAMPFLLALLSVSMAVPGCAGKFPADIWPALKACGSNAVSWAAATEVFGDLVEIADGNPLGETDLLAMLANDVGGAIPCLVNYFETQGGATGAAATKFKAAHAKELKAAAARGPSACRSPGDPTQKTGPTAAKDYQKKSPAGGAPRVPAGRAFAYAGESPGAALARCERTCGGEALAPPSGCVCRSGREWLAAR